MVDKTIEQDRRIRELYKELQESKEQVRRLKKTDHKRLWKKIDGLVGIIRSKQDECQVRNSSCLRENAFWDCLRHKEDAYWEGNDEAFGICADMIVEVLIEEQR